MLDGTEIEEPMALHLRLESRRRLHETSWHILQAAGEGVYGLDADGITTFANPTAEALTGWTAEELIGKPQHGVVHHSHADGSFYSRELCPIYMALRDGRTYQCDSEVFWRKDGTSFPVAYTSTPILHDGRPVGAVVLFQDISDRKRREEWDKAKNAIFLAITGYVALEATLAMAARAFVALEPCRSIAFFLRTGPGLRLLAKADVPGLQQHFTSDPEEGMDGPMEGVCIRAAEERREILLKHCAGKHETGRCEEANETCSNQLLARPLVSGSGQVLGVVAILDSGGEPLEPDQESFGSVCDLVRLAIEHAQLHAELVRQSQYDHLTGLPNRLLLEDRLEQAILQAKRHGRQVGVCFLDLDRFKQINDALGHSAGDSFLQHVAALLSKNVREIDTVARQGGDEFILILPDLGGETEAKQICARILSCLRERVLVGKHTLAPSASIGISMYPADGESGPVLLQNADTALYAAKRSGKDRAHQYESKLGAKVQRDVELGNALRFALERNQFSVVYQPLYTMDRQVKGFEALLRWNHPELGPVSPGQFIPLAEETGLIVAIGEWALGEACRQAKEWNTGSPHPVMVFVNVSGVQLNRPDFPEIVARALSRSGLAPQLLELEVTESWIVADPQAASMRLRSLRDFGIGVGIDDFGTGQSSFSLLQQLPIDTLKIDQSFIARLDGSVTGSAIVRAIIDLAKQLGLQTVAEGVETGQQYEELRGTQCGLLQGYLFAKPLLPEAAGLLLPPKVGVFPEVKEVRSQPRSRTATGVET